jgi:hypothetical protein
MKGDSKPKTEEVDSLLERDSFVLVSPVETGKGLQTVTKDSKISRFERISISEIGSDFFSQFKFEQSKILVVRVMI